MNSNKGMDPMLSCFVGDSIWNTKIIADIELPSSQFLPLTSGDPASHVPDSMLDSPEINHSSFTDLASLWNTERKRVTSVKTEDDEGFSDVGSSVMDTEDEIISGSISSPVPDDVSVVDSGDESMCKYDIDSSESSPFLISTEADARRYVEEKFVQIAYVPNPRSSQKEKIQFILSLSDCKEYSVEQVMNLDKKSSESARVCSKIVQNIPQRYRWECVTPELIPCCYTIVADCKKSSSRDKPPRPMNAFMIWAQGARRLINELCPKMQNAAISEALGYCWRQKHDSFKKRFEIEKAKLRRFHNFEFPEYKYKPKTKVQKAKEKEELSLSKAKLAKTATKRKRPCDTSPKEPPVRKAKCGRPKKIKLAPEKEQRKPTKPTPLPFHQIHTDKPVKIPPTKPAIKDMLTLKILNDRRTKEMAILNSPPREPIHHSLGQLSPIEVESPHAADIIDEMRELDSIRAANPMCPGRGEMGSRNVMSSSVYDTPANTPPVDLEDETRLSPVNNLKIHTSSSFVSKVTTSTPSSCTHPTVDFTHSPKNKKCLLSPQASMPSLTAILSSGRHIPPRNSQTSAPLVNPRLPLAQRNNGTQSQQQQRQQQQQQKQQQQQHSYADRRSARLSSTDVILSCVSEILDFPSDSKKDVKLGDFRDSNNNISFYENNNNNSSSNNNAFRLFDGFNSATTSGNSLSGMWNPKLSSFGSSKIFDFSDLDTLCPDLSVPLLSDDVMSSLMNTL